MSRSKHIAVVINLDWTMKHHMEVFAGTQEFARDNGLNCTLWPFAPEITDAKGKKLYDGIIGRIRPELQEAAAKAEIPIVNVWVNSPCQNIPAVLPDIYEVGQIAADHLQGRGFRRFGFVSFSRNTGSQLLKRSVLEAARKRGIKTSSFLTTSAFSENMRSWKNFQSGLQQWMKKIQAPIGIVADTDKLARYIVNAAFEQGLKVPTDVAVVGVENEEVICLNPEPSLTSIDLGWHQVGYGAGELLNKLMGGAKPPKAPILIPPIPITLVSRRSTDSFNVEDEVVAQALRFIAEQSHRPIKVRDVVDHVPLSWRALERRFQKHRETTISSEITRFRIERVKRMLAETDMLVKQVAEACGFANTRRLCEVFRRVEGQSPEQYRRQRKQSLRASCPAKRLPKMWPMPLSSSHLSHCLSPNSRSMVRILT